jgi:hypothetical protein
MLYHQGAKIAAHAAPLLLGLGKRKANRMEYISSQSKKRKRFKFERNFKIH